MTLRALAFLLAACGAASAQTSVVIPPDEAGEQDPAGTALVAAFGKFCLDGFPAPARMADIDPGHVTALPPAAVRQFLHDDPGRAWRYTASNATFIVTVEDPPYHTCAVRSLYATPPRYRLPWLTTTGLWAAAAGRQFGASQSQAMDQNGLKIAARMRLLPGAGGDVFMEIRTDYPDGRVEERLARRALEGARP